MRRYPLVSIVVAILAIASVASLATIATSLAATPAQTGETLKPDAALNPAPDKPKIAIFLLNGSADADLRDRVGLSMRLKLDRDGTYDAIDGPTMKDLAADAKDPVSFDSAPAEMANLASDEKPVIIIWGDLNSTPGKLGHLRLKILDLRQIDAKPIEFQRDIAQQTDVRFVVEDALKLLPGVKDFVHPSEEAVHHDAASDAAFASNPNLVVNGDFTQDGHWDALYESEKYPVKVSADLPETNKVGIYKMPAPPSGQSPVRAGSPNPGSSNAGSRGATPASAIPTNVLAMNLNKEAAENNGLACLSDPIKITPNTRYRLVFKYRSEGPSTHIFVKGYTMATDIAGAPELRQVYERQVPPGGSTKGKWVTVECDMSPQNITFPVQYLKIDLYAYLTPGNIAFTDIQLKAIGPQTAADLMKDDAIKPTTQPGK
jgi:hypothetical protein